MPLEALRHEITPLGLHYLLVHYDIPVVDPATWRLTIGGRVDRALELSLDDLRARERGDAAGDDGVRGQRPRAAGAAAGQPAVACRGRRHRRVDRRAAGGAAGGGGARRRRARRRLHAGWTAASRAASCSCTSAACRSPTPRATTSLLAYDCNGEPLPPQHGFPLRLVVPGWYGMTSVKWLQRITVVAEPFDGYQMVTGYRMRAHEDDEGTPVTRIEPRSLMVPPGIPDFLTRRRFLAPGPERLEGRAWSGWGPIERVEVSTDGGASWHGAQLGEPPGPAAWAPWWFDWDAPEGEHELCVRARDATGRSQPDEPPLEHRRLLEQRGPARARDGHRVSGSSRSAQARMNAGSCPSCSNQTPASTACA